MRIKHKKPVIILMAVICLALVINIAAAETYSRTKSIDAGIYGTLTGNTQQRGAYMTTSTRITENPDKALLKIKNAIYESSGDEICSYSVSSERGKTGLGSNVDVSQLINRTPSRIYSTHAVQDGTGDESYYFVVNFPVDASYYE